MSLRFIIGGSGSGKTRRLYDELIRDAAEHPGKQYFAIVPEQFTMQTQKDIVDLHPRHGVMNIDIVSFERLAYRIFEELAVPALSVLDDMGKAMVIRRTAGRQDLALFGRQLDKPGFVDELKSQLSEFLQYGITEEKISAMAEAAKSPMLRAKLADMGKVLAAFREYTEREGFLAREELLERLAGVLPRSEMVRGSVITLDGFTGFTPVQFHILEILLGMAEQVTVTVTMDAGANPYRRGEEQELFRLSRETVCRLVDLSALTGAGRGKDILLTGEFPRFKDSPELQFIERELFRNRGNAFAPDARGIQNGNGVRMVRTASPAEEVSVIAAEISRLVKSRGLRYRDIAVITGDLSVYRGEFAHQFEAGGIPYFIDSKKSIMENPATELVRSALEVLEKDFTYESVFRYLKCGFVLSGEEWLYHLENYVLALGIRGYRRWSMPWERTYPEAELMDLVRLNEVREQVLTPFGPLKEVFGRRGVTVRERTEALRAFLDAVGFEEQIEARAESLRERGEAVLAAEYDQIPALVTDLFDRIMALLGEEKVSRAEYADLLDAGFSEIKIGLIPAVFDRVVVGDITRTRLSHIRALFFAGLNDGVVPKASGGGGILSDLERQKLREMDVELAPTLREDGFRQRFYLYLAMTKPSERLYLSWHAASADGKTTPVSSLVGQVMRLFPDKTVMQPDTMNLAIWSEQAGLRILASGIRGLAGAGKTGKAAGDAAPAKGKDGTSDRAKMAELYRYFREREDTRGAAENLHRASVYSYTDRGIGKAAAKLLYGSVVRGSVTRLETFAECAYAHFMRYGLELRERREFEIGAADLGNIYHDALEKFFVTAAGRGIRVEDLTDADRKALIGECVAEAGKGYGNAVFESSARNRYLLERVARIADRSAWALTEQLRAGEFTPDAFELGFSPADNLKSMKIALPGDTGVWLRGRLDRVDVSESEEDLFVRVIDYKTGKAGFDLEKIYHGLQLQLVVYMQAAVEKYSRLYPGKRVRPAGLFYYHVDDPVLSTGNRENKHLEDMLRRELVMSGLAGKDPEILRRLDRRIAVGTGQTADSIVMPVSIKNGALTPRSSVADEKQFKLLAGHVDSLIRRDAEEILSGKISVNPCKTGGTVPCTYCPYRGICGFDVRNHGYRYRRLPNFGAEDIWRLLEKEADRKGGGEDGSQMDG